MIKLYLNPKQIVFLALPFFLVFYLYSNPKQSGEIVDSSINVVSKQLLDLDYSKMAEESFKNAYYKYIVNIKINYDLYEKSLLEINKQFSRWVIAYFYKDLTWTVPSEDKKGIEKFGNMGKLAKLQEMVDKRNRDISSNLGKVESQEDEDIASIMSIIKNRNANTQLKKVEPTELEYLPIDLAKYNLQMVMLSSKKPTVIINNKIYTLNQSIDVDIKVIKIKEEKVLLKNKKETKWLHLNN